MPDPTSLPDVDRYEQACDQAIAMCDGLRSTIKALIMANEYLELELRELQAALSNDLASAGLPRAKSDAA
jgi:regulator of replication initiation timing